jgi:hypothetical protein
MYKCVNGWTKQAMIEHIKKEFKGKSFDAFNEECLYRGPDGKKCAVGLFIPDSEYHSSMECLSPLSAELRDTAQYMPLQMSTMQYLQGVHDISEPSETLNDILSWIEKNVEAENV